MPPHLERDSTWAASVSLVPADTLIARLPDVTVSLYVGPVLTVASRFPVSTVCVTVPRFDRHHPVAGVDQVVSWPS
jgi:hypothetical protein